MTKNKYIIKKWNDVGKFWGNYDSTYYMVDAVAILHALETQGYTAHIDSEVSDE